MTHSACSTMRLAAWAPAICALAFMLATAPPCAAQIPHDETAFRITRVDNLYRPTNYPFLMGVVGSYSPGYKSTDNAGRIYESMAWNSSTNGPVWSRGVQYVEIEVTVLKPEILGPNAVVLWTWFDPDDPSDTRQYGGQPAGGRPVDADAKLIIDGDELPNDNTGDLAANAYIWQVCPVPESPGLNYDFTSDVQNNDTNPRNVWADVTTTIVNNKSRVRFNVSNHGGDNFVVQACLYWQGSEHFSDQTGIMTLWKHVPLKCVNLQTVPSVFNYGGLSLLPRVNRRFAPAFVEFVRGSDTTTAEDPMGKNDWDALDRLNKWVGDQWKPPADGGDAQDGWFLLGMARRFTDSDADDRATALFQLATLAGGWATEHDAAQDAGLTSVTKYAAGLGAPGPVLLEIPATEWWSVNPPDDYWIKTTVDQSGSLGGTDVYIDIGPGALDNRFADGYLLYKAWNTSGEWDWLPGGLILQSGTAEAIHGGSASDGCIAYRRAIAPYENEQSQPLVPGTEVVIFKTNNAFAGVNPTGAAHAWTSMFDIAPWRGTSGAPDAAHLLIEPKMYFLPSAFTNDFAMPHPFDAVQYREDDVHPRNHPFLWTEVQPHTQQVDLQRTGKYSGYCGYTVVPTAPFERFAGEHPDNPDHANRPVGAVVFAWNPYVGDWYGRDFVRWTIVHELVHCFRVAHRCGNRDFITTALLGGNGMPCIMCYPQSDCMFAGLYDTQLEGGGLGLIPGSNVYPGTGWLCAPHIKALRQRTLAELFPPVTP